MPNHLLLAFLLLPQQPGAVAPAPPPARPVADGLIERFGKLGPEAQLAVLAALDRALLTCPDECVQRVVGKQRGKGAYAAAQPLPIHDPKVFAPVAPARVVLAQDSDAHRRERERFPRPAFLDDLHLQVDYDWGLGKAVWLCDALPPAQQFANLARGFLPGSDQVVAQILAKLDDSETERPLASWFHHAYADVNGRVFAGISLYDAWYSGAKVDVPDVDAIAFARQVLRTDSHVSPIPADRRRDRLYQKITESALAHRRYRTLREAAAAAFVHAEPVIDETYRPLVARFHFLWGECGFSIDAMKRRLAEAGDRDRLLEQIDQQLRSDAAAYERQQMVAAELAAVRTWLQQLCAAELARAGG